MFSFKFQFSDSTALGKIIFRRNLRTASFWQRRSHCGSRRTVRYNSQSFHSFIFQSFITDDLNNEDISDDISSLFGTAIQGPWASMDGPSWHGDYTVTWIFDSL